MANRKSISDILWNVDEKTYREDPSYHYSMLSDFRTVGYHKVSEIFEKDNKKPSKSLIFGSLLDAMLTDPEKLSEFENIGAEKDKIKLTPTEMRVAEFILDRYTDEYYLQLSNDADSFLDVFNFCGAYIANKPETVLEKHGDKILKYVSEQSRSIASKMQITEEDYIDAVECKNAIMESPMREYFVSDPFEDDIERVFQAKIKFTDKKTGITYRVMLDNLVVNHTKKTIQPNDLKSTSDHEDEFYHSFIKWNYDIQARLYWRALYEATMNDPYFREFTILPFQFLVISRYSKTPIKWRYDDSCRSGQLIYLKRNNTKIILEDPFVIGKELRDCVERRSAVRPNISTISSNLLEYWIENGD